MLLSLSIVLDWHPDPQVQTGVPYNLPLLVNNSKLVSLASMLFPDFAHIARFQSTLLGILPPPLPHDWGHKEILSELKWDAML